MGWAGLRRVAYLIVPSCVCVLVVNILHQNSEQDRGQRQQRHAVYTLYSEGSGKVGAAGAAGAG